MRTYMEYIEELFLNHIGWNIEDSYSNITLTSQNLLDFDVPQGAAIHVSSQANANSFTDFTLHNLEILKGSISYLFSSCPNYVESTRKIPLSRLVQCYRRYPIDEVRHNSGYLLYGRMHLPGQMLEGMCIKTIGKGTQGIAKWIVDTRLPSPVILTASLQSAAPSWTRELIYSSHENLFGFRFLSNVKLWEEKEGQSRLQSGIELFYAANKKSPGMSAGVRYATHSRYSAVPLTLSLVSNPLMGSVSVAYALKPTPLSAFSSRFDFNLYSYLSDLTIGCELWRTSPVSLRSTTVPSEREGPVSVIKASTSLASQTAQILWEGSLRDFIMSTGIKFCYGDRAIPIRMGIEFVYSSSAD